MDGVDLSGVGEKGKILYQAYTVQVLQRVMERCTGSKVLKILDPVHLINFDHIIQPSIIPVPNKKTLLTSIIRPSYSIDYQ
jgi:hypothetical protein